MAHNPGAGTAHSPPAYHPSAGRYGGPNTHPYPPPPKQQRLSPNNATSPYESPPYTNGTITNTNFFAQSSSPTQTSSAFPAPYLNGNHLPTTSAVQASLGAGNMSSVLGSGAMGPPSKPVDDRPVDVNDLGDVLAGSGVDLREEEANLVGMMRKPVIQSSLYGSPALVPTLSDLSSNYFEHSARDYPTYSQNLPGSRSSFYGAGTFNQHALTEEQLQEQTRQKQALLVRKRAELCSHHAKNSFLNIGKLAANLKRRTDRNGVQLPDNQATTEKYNNTRVLVMPAQNADTLAVVQGSLQPLIQPFSPASDIMSLFSLGCKDRIMGLVEHSIWMAKSRLETSHGEVPPEFKDIAVGQGRAGEIEVDTPSLAQSRKRSFADLNSQSPVDDLPDVKRVKTIMFSSQDISLLDNLIGHEKEVEKKRIEKRALRNASQLPGDGICSGTSTPGGTNASGQSPANSLLEMKKMTKKELKKASESRLSEADIAKASNLTASMALGGGSGPSWLKGMGGGTKKKLDWLKSKQSSSTGLGAPASRSTSSTQVTKTSSVAVPARQNRPLRFGEKREEAAGYRKVQVRDLLRSMELDQKEKRALSKAYNKQK